MTTDEELLAEVEATKQEYEDAKRHLFDVYNNLLEKSKTESETRGILRLWLEDVWKCHKREWDAGYKKPEKKGVD